MSYLCQKCNKPANQVYGRNEEGKYVEWCLKCTYPAKPKR